MTTPPELPPWQADRLATLLDALGPIPLSDAERASLTWLAGFEAATVWNIAALILRARERSAVLAVRDLEVAVLARVDDTWADRYWRQLVDLCERAGIDPGEDPYAALLAHLRTWRTGR